MGTSANAQREKDAKKCAQQLTRSPVLLNTTRNGRRKGFGQTAGSASASPDQRQAQGWLEGRVVEHTRTPHRLNHRRSSSICCQKIVPTGLEVINCARRIVRRSSQPQSGHHHRASSCEVVRRIPPLLTLTRGGRQSVCGEADQLMLAWPGQ